MTRLGMRKTHCREGHDLSLYRIAEGKTFRCGKCRDEHRARRRTDPETRGLVLARERAAKFMRKYGLTDADIARLVEAQGGGCAVCGGGDWGPRGPNVDHCHEGGQVRGILCMPCNIGIGHFKDDPELLLSAATYLLSNKRGKK